MQLTPFRFHKLAVVLLAFCLQPIHADMVPFVLPWNDASTTLTDISDWSEKPAGGNGFLTANAEGELMSGDERIRLWGVNITGGACFPSHGDSDQIAARMAKYGINVVRFHHMNAPWVNDNTLIDYSLNNSRTLNPVTLDKLDYLIHALKENGIYTNLNLLVSRQFYAEDGLPSEISQLGWKESHTIGHFNDHHLDLQKEFASQLLNHTNPYTGLAYKDDATVAMVEILNENALFKAWYSGDLDKWPSVFQNEVTPLWNDWLAGKYSSTADLKAGWGFIEEPIGDELLANGDLRVGNTSGWSLEQHGVAKATTSIVPNAWNGNPALRITMTTIGTESWHIQQKYTPVVLESGKMYTIKFVARGSNGLPLNMSVSRNYNPWSGVGVGGSLTLDSEWQTVEVSFIAGVSDNDLRIVFNGFAKMVGYVEIAGLSLREGGAIGSLPEGTSVESANIPWPRLADNTGGAPEEMMRDWLRFLLYREIRYIEIMDEHIRDTIGYPGMVIETQMGYAPAEALVGLSAADSHSYWQHPNFPGSGWDPYNWYINNESMVNSAPGTIGSLAARRVKGIPYFISEYQHAYPNTYATEGPVLIGAYGALQNWDGVYFFNYGNDSADWSKGFFDGYFDISRQPGSMANMLLGAALFRREDIQAAELVYSYPSPSEDYFGRMLGSSNGGWVSGLNEFTFDQKNALKHRLEIDPAILNEESTGLPPDTSGSIYSADTNELVWDQSVSQKGYVRVDTPRTKALAGFINGRSFDLGGIQITPEANQQDWLTLGILAMEGESVLSDKGARCLLIATGECGNTGMQWNAEKNTLINNNWGTAPSRVEVIPAQVVLPIQHWRVRVWALDETGARASELSVEKEGAGSRFSIGLPSQTLWYEVEIAPLPVIQSSIEIESDGQTRTTTVSFNVDQAISQDRVQLESSTDMNAWTDVPDNTIQWVSGADKLELILLESGTSVADKFYRATVAE